MSINKIMFENEVFEIGKINEKYNPTAVKKQEVKSLPLKRLSKIKQ